MNRPIKIETTRKKFNFKKAVKDIFVYAKQFQLMTLIAIILAFAGAIFNIIGPSKIQDIVKLIGEGMLTSLDLTAIMRIVVLLAILYGTGFIFNYIQGLIMADVSQKLSYNLRQDMSKKINELPFSYYDKTTYGNVLSRITNDVDTIGQALNQSLVTLISAATLFIGSIVMMFVTNALLAIVAIISSLLGFVVMVLIMTKSQRHFIRQQQNLGQLNGYIEEAYSGQNIIRAFNGETKTIETFQTYNNQLHDSAWKSTFLSGLMQPLMAFIGNFGYVAVSVVGTILVVSGKIEFDVVIAFMLYIRLFVQPLSQFAQGATNIQRALAASSRVFEVLNEPSLADESHKKLYLEKEKVLGNVTFEHVQFGYEKDKTIIKDFSLQVKHGEKIAIVGPTGAGKTTIVNLLMRFYELDSGTIYLDETPMRDLTRKNVHELFSMVLQDTWLFEGSIYDNIRFNMLNITNKQIEEVAKQIGIDHFINTLPQKYDTILTDKVNISEGQKQLLTIARAMIQNAPLLILDEATSSVDTRTEIIIQNAMDSLMKDKTSFVIAHRLSTIKNASQIIVIHEGNIVETGNHEMLLQQKGFYYQLYNSQFELD